MLFSCRACRLWSAPYDGINPSSDDDRSDTPGGDVDEEEEFVQRVKSDSICSLVITPPPSALSPTPSSSDTISTSNQTGRASSALELEWDDIFADDDLSSSVMINSGFANGIMTLGPPPPLPPQHIQEMRRSAIKLVHGSYVEESEFQDDVLVYDLVAQKDTKAAMLERIMAANRLARGSISGQQAPTEVTTSTITTMFTQTGRTVMETVNSIMSTRRRSEDGEMEERRGSEVCGKEVKRRSEECRRETGRRREEEEDETIRPESQGETRGRKVFTNGFNVKNHIIDECDEADEDGQSLKKSCNQSDLTTNTTVSHKHTTHQQLLRHNTQYTNALPNGHDGSEPHYPATPPSLPDNRVKNNNGFLSQYHELMLSLGVEPDCDDIAEDIGTFRRRVRALRQKLVEEEEGLFQESGFSSSWDDGEMEGEEEEAMEEAEEGEETKGSCGNGVPFTGVFLCACFTTLVPADCLNIRK